MVFSLENKGDNVWHVSAEALLKDHVVGGVHVFFCANVWPYAITQGACFSQLALWANFGACCCYREKKMVKFTHGPLAAFLIHSATWAHSLRVCLSVYLSLCLSVCCLSVRLLKKKKDSDRSVIGIHGGDRKEPLANSSKKQVCQYVRT